MEETVLCHLLIFCARAAIVGIGVDTNAATWREETNDFDVFGIHQADEIFHDGIDTVLMKIAVVAEAEEVEVQALAFHHALSWEIVDPYFCEVGLSRDRA